MLNALLWNALLTAALAIVLAASCRLPSLGKRPALRYWLWLLLMAKLVTPPLVEVPLLPALAEREDAVARVTVPDTAVPEHEPSFEPPAALARSLEPDAATRRRGVHPAAPATADSGRWADMYMGLLAVSLLGTGVLLAVQVVAAVRLCRWLRRAACENPLLARSCADVASRLGVRRAVRSCVIDARTSPLLLAWFQPLLIVPRELLDELSPEQLQGVVAHELAHLMRRDHWANLFVLAVKALMWWNPVVWWADRELRAAQELCCDAIAIDRCVGDRRSYAGTLLKALDFIQTGQPTVPRALATAMGSRGMILRRFQMIGEKRIAYRLSRWSLLLLAAAVGLLVCFPVHGEGEKAAPTASATSADSMPTVQRRAVHKLVKDFPEQVDMSAPESVLAAIYRTTGKKDIHALNDLVLFPFESATAKDIEQALEQDPHVPKNLLEQILAVEIAEVLTYGDNLACIICKSDQNKHPYEPNVLVRVGGKWKGVGYAPNLNKQCSRNFPKNGFTSVKAVGDWFEDNKDDVRKALASVKSKMIALAAEREEQSDTDPSDAGDGKAPLQNDEKPKSDGDKQPRPQNEVVRHGRPQGDCSISGKVIAEATGQPVPGARMYLFYLPTFSAVFVNTDKDGAFIFKDIPVGPYSLQTSGARGYQDTKYNPEGVLSTFPRFLLQEGEHLSGIVLKVKQGCRIAGKVLDENGKAPENAGRLTVLAWFKDDNGETYRNHQTRPNSDGSFAIDGLSDKPVYVMVIDWRADTEDNAYPPIYYPSTFSRSEATLVTFDKGPSVEGITITRRKDGGLVIAGTVRDEAGNPIPEAFVVVHRRDMFFDFVTDYSDAKGHYEIDGLGDGEFLVHVNATPRGFVRTAASVDLDGRTSKTQLDFTLKQGVMISGRFVDKQGNPWEIGQSYGDAHVPNESTPKQGTFTLTGFDNKYAPRSVRDYSGSSFDNGEGPYYRGGMLFPTSNTFVIQGVMPGHTALTFEPKKEGAKVAQIRYDGHDIRESGIDTTAGQELRDVTIVVEDP